MAVFRAFFVGVFLSVICLPVFASGFSFEEFENQEESSSEQVSPDVFIKSGKLEEATEGSPVEEINAADVQTNKEVEEEKTELNEQTADESDKAKETDEQKESENTADVQKLKENYESAKSKEQSLANRMVSGVSMAATGIGGMELAQGLAEKSADSDADQDMQQYMSTFMCRIGEQKYSGGTMGIETAGANSLIELYQEYVDLAADLAERKTALGKEPGIESEVILDKASTGLYDDVGTGIQNGTYASLYRAKMGNQEDADELADASSTSSKRIKGGAIAAGAGVVVGAVGNSLINGKLGELIKDAKAKSATSKENKSAISELKKGLKSTGMKNVDELNFSNVDISGLLGKMGNIDWSSLSGELSGQDAKSVINTTNATSLTNSLTTMFNGGDNTGQ